MQTQCTCTKPRAFRFGKFAPPAYVCGRCGLNVTGRVEGALARVGARVTLPDGRAGVLESVEPVFTDGLFWDGDTAADGGIFCRVRVGAHTITGAWFDQLTFEKGA